MSKKILIVGNCNLDQYAMTSLLTENFDVEVYRAHGIQDTQQLMESNAFDLILVNRVMDRDGRSGLEIIQWIKKSSSSTTPVMMITNYSEHQELAIAAGAESGFGKADLHTDQTLNSLKEFLTE